MALYLGLDSSTQSLTAVLIEVGANDERNVLFQHSLLFDSEFPGYGTRHGVLPPSHPQEAHSSPLLWAEALDRMFEVIAAECGPRLSELVAIAGSGQQHGSVYLRREAADVLPRLNPERPLALQLEGIFSRPTSPIWMDSSTAAQCQEITSRIGGAERLAQLTGSRAFERFTGPQIRKFYQTDGEAYAATDRIHLVSSFLASLLAGRHAPIDLGDGAGMNLMDLARRDWASDALEVTAPDLADKLPRIAESWTDIGRLSRYWVERYGFPANAQVIAWSGDNPCSLIGVGLVCPGRIAISLGTSDTLFGFMPSPRVDPDGRGHVFGSPTGDYMSLICFLNGSLARERICKQYGLDWDGFSDLLRSTAPGNGGQVLLPWFEAEITPHVAEPGERRYGGLQPSDPAANVRAVVEAQMMATSIHSEWMGVDIETIYATGGGARNREILRVMADVHDANVFQLEVEDSAALGAALRAFHAAEVAVGREPEWTDVVRGFVEPAQSGMIAPDPDATALYACLKEAYRVCERHALTGDGDPEGALERFRKP